MRIRATLTLCLVSILWGSGWVFAPSAGASNSPLAATAFAFGLAACGLLPFQLLPHTHTQTSNGTTALILAITMLALPAALVCVAGEHDAGGWVPWLYALLPLLVAFPGQSWSIAMVVAFGATLVLLGSSVVFSVSKLPWAALCLAVVAMQAFALRYAARQFRSLPAAQLLRSLLLQCASACVLLGAASLLFDPSPLRIQWTGTAIIGFAWTAFPATALAYTLLYRLLGQGALSPRQIAVTQWLQLLTGLVEASAFAHAWPAAQVLAAAVVLAGCAATVLASSADTVAPITLGVDAADTRRQ